MEVLLFVIFWAVLAVALLAVALMGGRRGARTRRRAAAAVRGGTSRSRARSPSSARPSRSPPASAPATTRGRSPARGSRSLTPEQERGRELFAKYCALCHSLSASNAVAQVGPNLDQLRPTRELVLDAINNGRARGNGAMAATSWSARTPRTWPATWPPPSGSRRVTRGA
jgi:mono/diheme cytochrome c family protein